MRERFEDRTEFLTVYIKEAHADDEWQMGVNENEGVCYGQPTTLAERARTATAFVHDVTYEIPIVIDSMDNAVEEAYAGWPERLYVIDEAGVIAYKGGVGPMDFDPDELESWLEERFNARGLLDLRWYARTSAPAWRMQNPSGPDATPLKGALFKRRL